MARHGKRRRWATPVAGPPVEEVEARAARLGITAERVLQEYARIAFSSIERIVGWDEKGVLTTRTPGEVAEDDLAAVAEIVASASNRSIYRVKLHDKKPVLDALARHLRLLPLPATERDNEELSADGEDPREFLIREIDRLAAEEAAGSGNPGTEPG